MLRSNDTTLFSYLEMFDGVDLQLFYQRRRLVEQNLYNPDMIFRVEVRHEDPITEDLVSKLVSFCRVCPCRYLS